MNKTTAVLIFTLMLATPFAAHAASTTPANRASVQGVGLVKAIGIARHAITVRHEPIAALDWPAMTMVLKVASPQLLARVKVGDRIRFTLQADSAYDVITGITPMKP